MMENIMVLTSSLDFLTVNSFYFKKKTSTPERALFFSTNSLIHACKKTPIQEEQF